MEYMPNPIVDGTATHKAKCLNISPSAILKVAGCLAPLQFLTSPLRALPLFALGVFVPWFQTTDRQLGVDFAPKHIPPLASPAGREEHAASLLLLFRAGHGSPFIFNIL